MLDRPDDLLDVVARTAQGHLTLPRFVGRPSCASVHTLGQTHATDFNVCLATRLRGLTGASSNTMIAPSLHLGDAVDVISAQVLANQATGQPVDEVVINDLFTAFSQNQAYEREPNTRNYCR
jgi:hypothetical protein